MNAQEVIESYVRDVAGYLPRAKRNDVAFELRALLAEELAARARAEGRAPDRAMAMELLKGFGRPAEAAGRYSPRSPIIDPSDNHNFVIWAVAGALLLGGRDPQDGSAFLNWLGVLVIAFGILGWYRRRNPDEWTWRPKRGPEWMPRSLGVLALAGTLFFPFFQYVAPQTFVEVAFFGAVPTGGLVLTAAFEDSWQRAATIVLLALLVAAYAGVVVQGKLRPWARSTMTFAHFFLGVSWILHAVPMRTLWSRETFLILESPAANRIAMPIFGGVGAALVLMAMYEMYKDSVRIRPAPALEKPPAS